MFGEPCLANTAKSLRDWRVDNEALMRCHRQIAVDWISYDKRSSLGFGDHP